MAKMKLYAEKDKELFKEVKKLKNQTLGDFSRVYDLSKKYIHKIIYDIVQNEEDTEDIMQETYLQIYNKIGTLEKPEAFYVWAGRIATNKTLRYIRKNRQEMLVEAEEDGGTDFVFERMSEDTEKFIPEAILMDLEKQRILADILDKLPLEQKICVQFFYYEEMSVKEIAQAFGCSEGTVKSRLNYARKAIKAAVVDMDVKYGTRLYSFAAAPLCWVVFRNMLAGTLVVGSVPAHAIGGGIIRKFAGTTGGKATIGITAAAVVVGGGYAAYQAKQSEPDYTNMIAIYYMIPATELGYVEPFRNYNEDMVTNLVAYVGADSVTGAEAFLDQNDHSNSIAKGLGYDWRSPQYQQINDICRQDLRNIADFMGNTVDMEYTRKFYEENAKEYIREIIPEKERFDKLSVSDLDTYEAGSHYLWSRVESVEKSKNEWKWTEIEEMFPDTAEIVIDGSPYDFAIEGKYVYMGGYSFAKYQEDAYAELKREANAAGNPVVYKDIYENGILWADKVIFCVYGHIDGETDISQSKYVKYKGEDGGWHYYADRWEALAAEEATGESDSSN